MTGRGSHSATGVAAAMGEAATAAVIAAAPAHVAAAATMTTPAAPVTATAVPIDNDRGKCDEADGDEPHDGAARFAKMIQICGE
jgi:hypothetical protein